jgi:hypothetical protein
MYYWNIQKELNVPKSCPGPPTGAPVFQVEPQDVTVRSGEDVALRCQATGEPEPTIEWLRAGQPLRASRRLRTLPDGSLWLERAEAGDAGAYECVAHNLLGSATAQAFLAVRGMGCPFPDLCGQGQNLLPRGDSCVIQRGPGLLPCQLPKPFHSLIHKLRIKQLGASYRSSCQPSHLQLGKLSLRGAEFVSHLAQGTQLFEVI